MKTITEKEGSPDEMLCTHHTGPGNFQRMTRPQKEKEKKALSSETSLSVTWRLPVMIQKTLPAYAAGSAVITLMPAFRENITGQGLQPSTRGERASPEHGVFSLRAQATRLPCGSGGNKSACQCRRHGFDPCIGKVPLEKEMATRSSVLAWRLSRTEEPGGLQSRRSQRVEHN